MRVFISMAFIFLTGLMPVTAVSAQTDNDQLVCAAIFPCDAEGNVKAPFNEGACAAGYEAICQQNYSIKISRSLAVCQADNSALSVELGSLKKKVLRMKQKVSRLQAQKRGR